MTHSLTFFSDASAAAALRRRCDSYSALYPSSNDYQKKDMLNMLEREADRKSTYTVLHLLEVWKFSHGGVNSKPIWEDDANKGTTGESVNNRPELKEISDGKKYRTGKAEAVESDKIPEGDDNNNLRGSDGAGGAEHTPEPCGKRCPVIMEHWPCRNLCDLRRNHRGRCVCADHLPPPLDLMKHQTLPDFKAVATKGREENLTRCCRACSQTIRGKPTESTQVPQPVKEQLLEGDEENGVGALTEQGTPTFPVRWRNRRRRGGRGSKDEAHKQIRLGQRGALDPLLFLRIGNEGQGFCAETTLEDLKAMLQRCEGEYAALATPGKGPKGMRTQTDVKCKQKSVHEKKSINDAANANNQYHNCIAGKYIDAMTGDNMSLVEPSARKIRRTDYSNSANHNNRFSCSFVDRSGGADGGGDRGSGVPRRLEVRSSGASSSQNIGK